MTQALTPAARISRRHWLIPPLVVLLTTPLWLGVYEPHVFYFFNRQLAALPDLCWALLSLFGTGWAVYAATAWSLLRAPRILLSWLCAAPLAGVLTRVGKHWALTPRPLEVLDPQTVHVIGDPLFIAAMPSGHTLTAFAGAAAIYFALDPARRLRHLWLFAIALGVGLSRMAVGAHWPADVSIGAAIGLLSGLTGAWLAARIPAHHLQPQAWLMRAVALLGGYSFYVLWTDEMGFAINLPWQRGLALLLVADLLFFAWRSLRRPAN